MKIRWKTMIVMAPGVALAIPTFGAVDAGTNPLSPASYPTTGWSAGNRPNVIVIISDDQGWADIGYNNPLSVYTPNLDSLAEGGARFSNHYVMPQCSPTRVALMTGQYPSRHGIQAQQANNEQCFAHGTLTMSSLLKEIGYETYMAGKWHLGSHPEWGPLHHGFDHAYGSFAGAVGMYNHRYHVADDQWAITWHRDHEIIPGYENGTHVTDLVAREAVRVIQQKHDKPFFLYLPFHAPHTPLDERGPFVDTPRSWIPSTARAG